MDLHASAAAARAALALAAAVLIGPAPAPTSEAQVTTCGAVLTADVRLSSDLAGCEGDGLVVGADGITIDLDGHTVAGTRADDSAGIRIEGRRRVTIQDGAVTGFERGIVLQGADRNRLFDLDVEGNGAEGLLLDGSDDNRLETSTLRLNATGVRIDGARANRLRANLVRDNDIDGIVVSDSSNTTIERNELLANGLDGDGDGLFLDAASTRSTVIRNRSAGSADDGLEVLARGVRVAQNVVYASGDLGIEAAAGVRDGGGNRAAGNADPRQCAGVACASLFPPVEPFTVQPFYVLPHDQRFHPEYEFAAARLTERIRVWYADRVDADFRLAPLQSVRSAEDYVTMRCGPEPTPDCASDKRNKPFLLDAAARAVGGLAPRRASLLFVQGAGGFAGANLFADFQGFAMVGDWTLEPISGVVEPEAVTCDVSDGWQCVDGVPEGTPAHELGHAFGVHHPDGYPGSADSLMGWHGGFPDRILLAHERMVLRESPFFIDGAFDEDGPRLAFETTDVMHWGEAVLLPGDGFASGDEVEFRDADHAVRVLPSEVTPTSLTLTVPPGLGPGYVRVWRGSLRSAAIAVNIYP